jgi:D-alanyl-lipoteichoic acid acyltransferase DltB (MBOAT superfamily)
LNFNTPEFLLFFPAVLLLYGLVRRNTVPRETLLLAASYFFYMSWDWRYAGLLAFSTAVDWALGLALGRTERPRPRRVLLVVSLVVNLGILGLFKYWNFVMESLAWTSAAVGSSWTPPLHRLLLPVGVSFYTFQSLSYTIDVYRREIPVERSLRRFALFVSFFPQLVAGPIVRASEFLPQLHRTPRVTREAFHSGLLLIFRGLVKKVVLADLLAVLAVDPVFARPTQFGSLALLLGLYAYAFQIYCDFSGYSDVAIGAARMLGYAIPKNFERPYLARNVRDFWARWHISLSTWLRDYLYIPLGGNRGARWKTVRNLMLTMLLGGLWHGAAWTFVAWGAWHGLLLVLARGSAKRPDATEGRAVVWRQRLITFHLVLLGWLLFRAQDLPTLTAYAQGLVALRGGTALHPAVLLLLALAVAAHVVPKERVERWSERFLRLPVPLQGAAYAGAILAFCGLSAGGPSFIYFQF